ncbi:MAG TPA: homoserine kinase [Motilibacterales bacterium]|nr:homoserine kinase [Motilibacterales bacterium]
MPADMAGGSDGASGGSGAIGARGSEGAMGSDGGLGSVVIEVPATSANLGPGFDCLGLALGLFDRIEARFTDRPGVTVEVVGEGAGRVPTDGSNLVARIVRTGLATFDETGVLATRGLALRCQNAIPQSRGLGSSAAAIVGGLAVAAHLAGVADSVSAAEMVALATRLEGHPDNVAPGVLGGATIAWMQSGELGPVGRATRFAVHPALAPVLVIPGSEASTARARGALPAAVPHPDAAFNAGRAALLVHALSSDPELLLEATDDRLHQQQRRTVFPASMELVEKLRSLRIPAAISGAGPAVIAFAADGDGEGLAARIGDHVGDWARVRVLAVSDWGVRVR